MGTSEYCITSIIITVGLLFVYKCNKTVKLDLYIQTIVAEIDLMYDLHVINSLI